MKKSGSGHLWLSTFIGLCLLFCVTFTAGAVELSDKMLSTIKKLFPDCKIVEVEEENWKGKKIIEVDLVAKDGTPYEVIISKEGQILKIEEDD